MTGKILSKILLLGLVISFCFALPTQTKTVPYMNTPTLDAYLNTGGGEWKNPTSMYVLIKARDQAYGLAYFLHDSKQLCIGTQIYDSVSSSKDNIYLWFDLNENDVEDSPDYRETIYRGGPYTSDEGGLWTLEKCISYSSLGIKAGIQNSIAFHIEATDEDYTFWPMGFGTLLEGEGNWDGLCSLNSDCAADEYCSNNVCVPIQTGDCGYIINHDWVDYQCCEDNDCSVGTCDLGTHTCIGECEIHEQCADDEYCSNYQCLDVPTGTCGYVLDHSWHDYECCQNSDCSSGYICSQNTCIPEQQGCASDLECCSNADCDSDEYCSSNVCHDVPTGDCGYISDHAWYDYECCSDSDCDSDEECESHECEQKDQKQCSGTIDLDLLYKTTTDELKAIVSGLFNCEGKIVTIHEASCSGETLCYFESGDRGGNCDFPVPDVPGLHLIYACLDKDGDGAKEFDYEVYLVEECESDGCEPSEWSDCECEEGETEGIQTGVCTDNCNKDLEYEQDCECELPTPPQEQLDAEEAIEDAEELIEEAEELGKDVSEAQEKLDQAVEAYNSEAYALAEELANEAVTLIPEDATEELDLLFAGGIVAGIIVLGLIAIYFLGAKK